MRYPKENDKLCPNVFDGDKVSPLVRKQALEYALDSFIESKLYELGIGIEDIMLTGSLAGYRYTDESDFDLHILVGDVDEVTSMLLKSKAKEINNNELKPIIAGHPTEIYFQPKSEPHHSDGMYSLLEDKWIKKPKKGKKPDLEGANKIIEENIKIFLDILQDYLKGKDSERLSEDLDKALGNFLKLRKQYLDITDDELSAGNVAFKALRREGIIDGLKRIIRLAKIKKL